MKRNLDLEKMSIGHMDKTKKETMVYVGNLVYSKTEQHLFDLFKKYGYVSYVRVNRDKRTKKSQGIAFVQMKNKTDAMKAIQALDGSQLDGRTLKASIALDSPSSRKRHPARRGRTSLR